jgi:multiple sugar transport system ATP-binding protein
MAKVLLENVSKFFIGPKKSRVTAVTHLNLEIQNGEFAVLLGPSGCGKTTTLRMIAGLEEIDEGSIYMDDIKVNDVQPKDRDIAMVFQNYALYPHLNVFDNMSLGLKLRKFQKTDIKERIEEASSMLGIGDLLERMPDQLSGGQRQRVAVGRALVRRPKVFLFDEPLSNLDARMRLQMRIELTELHQKLGSTMIYVTHDQAEAMTMGDRIVVMHQGEVQQVDQPVEVYQRPKNQFVAGFIGSPPMNLLEINFQPDKSLWSISGTNQSLDLSEKAAEIPTAATSLKLGFRPETAELVSENNVKHTDGLQMQARVHWLEPTGADTYVHLAIGEQKIIVRASSNSKWQASQNLTIRISPEHVHLFGGKGGERL